MVVVSDGFSISSGEFEMAAAKLLASQMVSNDESQKTKTKIGSNKSDTFDSSNDDNFLSQIIASQAALIADAKNKAVSSSCQAEKSVQRTRDQNKEKTGMSQAGGKSGINTKKTVIFENNPGPSGLCKSRKHSEPGKVHKKTKKLQKIPAESIDEEIEKVPSFEALKQLFHGECEIPSGDVLEDGIFINESEATEKEMPDANLERLSQEVDKKCKVKPVRFFGADDNGDVSEFGYLDRRVMQCNPDKLFGYYPPGQGDLDVVISDDEYDFVEIMSENERDARSSDDEDYSIEHIKFKNSQIGKVSGPEDKSKRKVKKKKSPKRGKRKRSSGPEGLDLTQATQKQKRGKYQKYAQDQLDSKNL